MPVDAALRTLSIDIPSQPAALMQLALLLAEDDVNLKAVSELVESDMALASAVLKAVNSSLYGVSGRVQSVHQALNYLGTREIVGLTYEMGLRAAFAGGPELDAIWERARVRGFLMGRLAAALGMDAWVAHSAGLFEECGKAVLFKHDAARYRPLLSQAPDDEELLLLEHEAFGVSHDALGAALCETWGLAAPAAQSVRYHVVAQRTLELPMHVPKRGVCLLSVIAWLMVSESAELAKLLEGLAPQADLPAARVWQAVQALQSEVDGRT
jgi:HD-like signal output (HDOD) protein